MCRTAHLGTWLTTLFVSLAVTSASVPQNKDSGCGIRLALCASTCDCQMVAYQACTRRVPHLGESDVFGVFPV